MAELTKAEFLRRFEAGLKEKFLWARDERRRANFMRTVRQSLDGGTTWSAGNSDIARAICKDFGVKPSLKSLRALPDGD